MSDGSRTTTFAELDRASLRVAGLLTRLGVEPGEQAEPPGVPRGRLGRAARRDVLDAGQLATDRTRGGLTDDDAALTEVATSTELISLATELVANLTETTMIRAFRRLPENYRLILLLTEVEQQPNVVVGPILGMSDNAVAALAYRARLRLGELYRLEDHATRPVSDCSGK